MVCRHLVRWALIGVGLGFLFGRISPSPLYAQTPTNQWRPAVLIAPDTGSQWSAQVVGDAAGHVYIVWAGHSSLAQPNISEDVVYFRAWDGTAWREPVDILAVPPGERLLLDRFVLDSFGRLLLLWHTGRELYLSAAVPAAAGSAAAWRTDRLSVGEQIWGADLSLGPDGALHVLLAGDGQNIAYLQSSDLATTWSEPSAISLGDDPIIQVQYPALARGADGVLHVTWTEHDGRHNWTGVAVRYARSTDNGRTWSEPISLVEAVGHGSSAIAADGRGRVWLFWYRSVGSEDGRYYAYSEDNGLTWHTPLVAFFGISGFSRQPLFVWDSSGHLRLFFAGQEPSGTEIWQSVWRGDDWSEPLPVQVAGRGTGSEVFQASMAGGNTLLMTWTDYNTDDIWLTTQTLAVRAVADAWLPIPIPPATLTPTPMLPPTPTSQPRAMLAAESLVPPPVGLPARLSFPLAAAGGVVALLLVGILLVREVRR